MREKEDRISKKDMHNGYKREAAATLLTISCALALPTLPFSCMALSLLQVIPSTTLQ